MTIPQETLDEAEQMARAGKMISKIAYTLEVNYNEIKDYLYSIGVYSWLGAKGIITRRLKSLVVENNRARRQELANEANEMVDYLYYQGITQAKTLDKVKKAIK